MKKIIASCFLVALTLNASTQTVAQKQSKPAVRVQAKPAKPAATTEVTVNDPVLLTVAGDNIPRSEFDRVFRKNNNKDSTYDEKAVREYLDLYINYKLKVKEAEAQKLDTSETFINELSGYRKQLAQPYLTDKEVSENLIREAYERLKKDVHASHILIKVAPDALPRDTVAAYNRILKIREMIMKGADFGKVARDSSEDPSAKENNGDLGYFTGMQMVYPFETAAFNTKAGQVSAPVRTRFGYHLIKVIDSRPAQGEIHVAHIMVKLPKDASDSTVKAAKARIDEAYGKLKNGVPFDTLVNKYSDDKSSAKKGGEIAWFGTGRMVPEFEHAAFGLKKDGDYSEPVKTNYGWHIIKRLEKREVSSFEEKKGELKQAIMKDSRNDMSKTSMVNKIKTDYQFKEFPKNKTEFIQSLDTNLLNGEWDLNKADKFSKPLFTLNEGTNIKTFTQQDFAKYVSTHQSKHPNSSPQVIGNELYNSFVTESLLAFEETKLDSKYPDFSNLMKEYRDGILLFDLTDQMVWSKAVKDTNGLKEFHEKNKNNYMWPSRAEAVIYTLSNDAIAAEFHKQLKKGKYSVDTIIARINRETPGSITLKQGKFVKGDNEYVDKTPWAKGFGNDVKKDNQVILVEIKDVLPPQSKSLDEAKGLITADYQSYLEKSWIQELRSKYPVKVNVEVLQTMWK